MTRREKAAVVLLVAALVLLCNWQFIEWTGLGRVLKMNDVAQILTGYRQTPNLLVDGLRWWRGTWIEDGIHAFRPLASYLYWIESWIGLRWGFAWVGWIGVVLLLINCLLSTALAWRLTRSKPCAVLAGALAASLRFWNWSGVGFHPEYWLAWYPIHQELLMNALMLGALLSFDAWHKNGQRKFLGWAWVMFGLGALTKEHVYIFPLFAAAILLHHHHAQGSEARVAWGRGLGQAAWMLGAVGLLWCYRAAIIVDPRNPHLKKIHLIRKPFLYVLYPFYKPILAGQDWFAGLALLLFCLAGAVLKVRRSKHRALLDRPFAEIGVFLLCGAIISLYCTVFYLSLAAAFWYLFDPGQGMVYLWELATMLCTLYALYLLWKYRREEPTLAAFSMLVLSYVPVITYLGWHYTLPACFVRSAYWAVIAKLVWIDTGRRQWPTRWRWPTRMRSI